jgi:diguanylate cyclase (GGDEF)-like protein
MTAAAAAARTADPTPGPRDRATAEVTDHDLAAETSGATTSLILRTVEQRGGVEAVERLVALAGVPHTVAELQDPARWVSYRTRIRLFEAATEVLEDPRSPFDMGREAIRSGLAHSLVLLLRALGSPAQVYRQLHRSVPKFTTTSTMEVREVSSTRAVLRYRLHDGYVHSRLDCLYTQGLVGCVPEIFGLRAARVVHTECQSDGHPACVYQVTWDRRRSWWRSRQESPVEPELVALRGQLEELQSAATDLVRTDDLSGLLRRITERAAAAVLAPSYLLALHDPDGGEPLVHSRGLTSDAAGELAGRLLAGDPLGDNAVVVEIASSRRVHGRLAALHAPGQRGPDNESTLLSAYAGHAAAALDLLTALADSRRDESRSTALLSLAHDVRSATEQDAIARVVPEAVRRIVGSDASTVLTWDAASGRLIPLISTGITAAEEAYLDATVLEPQTCPELTDLLTKQQATSLPLDATHPTVRDLMAGMDLAHILVTPLLVGGEFFGVATAAWRPTSTLTAVDEALTRLSGVAEFVSTAMQNARLLATVRHQSLHDALTRLPNRVLLGQELDRALQRPGSTGRVALLFCDLDRFKQVNDALGHAAGDELLRQAARRLRAAVRPGDLVARLSGDEFAILLDDLPSTRTADDVAAQVVASLAAPFRVDGLDLRVTTSVGVAVHRGEDGAAGTLLRAADGAMYAAKQRGRNQVAHADDAAPPTTARPRAGAGAGAHPSLAGRLRDAAGNGELRLHFQRLVEIGGGTSVPVRTVGAEALLRWEHPELGLLGPAAFLPLAEETGLVVDLDLWAIRRACATLAAWDAAGSPEVRHVAVNTAARTLCDPRLEHTVRQALGESDLEPHRLYLEVVESRSLVDLPGVVERLSALRRLGVRVSLDDFGTGYSTLTWLQRLPVDQIKLDRSFTSGITEDAKSAALARGVVALTRELGLELVAEGVETPQQLTALRDAGFTRAQGYLWGRPAPDLDPADRP